LIVDGHQIRPCGWFWRLSGLSSPLKKIIAPVVSDQPEKAQIAIEGPEHLY
jgi:hypothetical protein